MVNHFRTLILNKPFLSKSEHIAKNYATNQLPAALKSFGNILIPAADSDYYKLHRVYNFERAIQAAGLEDFEKTFDTRVTYLLDELTDNFSYDKIFPPIPANASSATVIVTAMPVFTLPVAELILNITQLSNSDNIEVYRRITETGETTKVLPSTSIVWSGTHVGVSDPIMLPVYNVKMSFSTADSFVATSNKSWSVTLNARPAFELLAFIDSLKSIHQSVVKNMLAYKSKYSTLNFDMMWENHANKVYQLAGLLLGYFYRVQTAIEQS